MCVRYDSNVRVIMFFCFVFVAACIHKSDVYCDVMCAETTTKQNLQNKKNDTNTVKVSRRIKSEMLLPSSKLLLAAFSTMMSMPGDDIASH